MFTAFKAKIDVRSNVGPSNHSFDGVGVPWPGEPDCALANRVMFQLLDGV